MNRLKLVSPVLMWLIIIAGAALSYVFFSSSRVIPANIFTPLLLLPAAAYWLYFFVSAAAVHRKAGASAAGIDKLVTKGVYARVRHPIYSADIVLSWGIAFYAPQVRVLAAVLLADAIFVIWMYLEEKALADKFKQEYRSYKQEVPKVIPRLEEKFTAVKKWDDLHKANAGSDWISKPSIFAESVVPYLPKTGSMLELGAGQGQDSRFFAALGYSVTSTDLSEAALNYNREKLDRDLEKLVTLLKVDMRVDLPFKPESFDFVYAHMSLHYFDSKTTENIFLEIRRVLKPGGTVAVLVNSVKDPEYGTGKRLEEGLYRLEDGYVKKFFSVEAMSAIIKDKFDVFVLDDKGETYKDRAKGVSNLIRFIGRKRV